jgi:uncharacterized protein YecE (DUF72 family)
MAESDGDTPTSTRWNTEDNLIYVGTCGFSYDDWRGTLYPADLKKGSFLEHYSSEFNVLELNTTYYRLPEATFIENLGRRTPPGFKFFIKAFRGITHEIGPDTPAQLERFLAAIKPLGVERKLGGILIQFPYSYHLNARNSKYLNWLLDAIPEIPTVVEFRNRKWFEEEIFSMLREKGVGFCSVDEPRLKGLLPPIAIVTSDRIGYVRFHGRNAGKWWEHDDPSERYDYLYSKEELSDWREKILDMASRARNIFVMFNNHRGGKAVINARQMRSLLSPP